MPFVTDDLRKAMASFAQFQRNAASPHHARYSFPFFAGTYFSYRKVDVLRVVAIARAVNDNNPSYLDVGCGYGDFLKRIREYLPGAEGLEKDAGIFYGLGIAKPDYIRIADAHWIDRKYDVIFVGWMEPGQDFRDPVARSTDVIVTTLDQGISLAAEFDGHGFERVAWWRTPSWEDVNIEIMNRHYTKMPEEKRAQLARMRGAHNLWYVYARPNMAARVKKALEKQAAAEPSIKERYDFESVLDECGFGYMQQLENPAVQDPLWQVRFG
ncbi:class I SAM-dependent methyltransferase [Nitrososphaera viennensis]|uniref:Class I SAM-dependent methyltransferase n=2 Tax=Nitrososphaera viennensis TaxID=1034015 RepID=A0A060HM16_9ARCH|nr:class I SAM-dependent methyltransferase [Nitrososphaera viennensis]AIC16508.1 hypothetical protein NVIE_022470 [Nitrososphaera viennensis EN76]UVS68441.1 class I SAM-dependent methyltransferase [Nitrososphaera viennensis]